MPKKQGAAKTTVEEATEVKPSRHLKLNKRRVFWGSIIVVGLVVTGFTGMYFVNRYNQAQNEVKRLSNPDTAAKDQQEQLIEEVGKLVELPKDESPTIATVSDVTKLQNQPFFQDAQNGDKVLIYTQSKRAILYRPSTHKVIEVSRVNLGDSSAEGTSPAPAQ